METETLLWIFGVIVVVILAICGALFNLALTQREHAKMLEQLDRELGGYDTGMRGRLHRMANKILEIDERTKRQDESD